GSTRMSMYVVALDRKGQLAWKHTFTNAKPWSIARRADGVVVVSGTLEGLSDFGGGTFGLKTADTTFIAAFDARGNHLFSRAFDMSNMGGSHVAFLGDSTIDLFATLGFNVHDLDFGDGPHRGITSLGTAVARFDDHGKCLKSSIISILAKSVAVGPSGDAVVTGETTEPESNARSQLVLRVDGDGHEMWRRAFPSDTVGFRWAPVALDAHGNALSAILAPTALGEPSFVDVILFDKLGTEIYRQRMHDDAYLRISDVAFSSSGAAFIAGQSTGRELVYDGDVLPANHSFGVFLMKLPNPAAK
ncbi:MAG: hypothetical protein ACREJX_09275, partial [Polyangiaceae bacterium]